MRERDEYDDERDIATIRDEKYDVWVPKTVEKRLVEAARLIVATAGPVGPKQFGSAMPVYQRDWADWLAQLDQTNKDPEDARIERDERPMRTGASSRQITRMEDAMRWPVRFLKEHDGPRRVLAVYLRCRAYRKPFVRACKRLGWPRATAYRARDKALGLIAQGLNREGVEVDV